MQFDYSDLLLKIHNQSSLSECAKLLELPLEKFINIIDGNGYFTDIEIMALCKNLGIDSSIFFKSKVEKM